MMTRVIDAIIACLPYVCFVWTFSTACLSVLLWFNSPDKCTDPFHVNEIVAIIFNMK